MKVIMEESATGWVRVFREFEEGDVIPEGMNKQDLLCSTFTLEEAKLALKRFNISVDEDHLFLIEKSQDEDGVRILKP